MSESPSYADMLSRIASGEAGGEVFLNAWAETTPREDVRAVLRTIAIREGEHAKAFTKRLCELGQSVEPREDPSLADRMKIVRSKKLTDREKFEKLGIIGLRGAPQIFGKLFEDITIDPQTGALLGRFIAEERDSLRMFESCYGALCEEAGAASNGNTANGLEAIEKRLARIEAAVDKISRGKKRPRAK